MKTLAKSALCALYKYSGAMSAQERLANLAGRSFMAILLLHRVTDEIPEDSLTMSTRGFRALCRMLQRRFRVVRLGDVVRILNEGQRPPRRTVAITFDDCYRDNLVAARTLAEFGLPACFFIPTGFVGTEHTFEWDRTLKKMPNLSWADVEEMARLGHEIGSHTVSHVDMGKVSDDQARDELVQSKKTIEARLHRPVRWFAYPFGGRANFKAERLPLVYEAGYEACFSGFGGFVTSAHKGQVLPRENVPSFSSLINLELHLTGCLDWFYAVKRRVGLV